MSKDDTGGKSAKDTHLPNAPAHRRPAAASAAEIPTPRDTRRRKPGGGLEAPALHPTRSTSYGLHTVRAALGQSATKIIKLSVSQNAAQRLGCPISPPALSVETVLPRHAGDGRPLPVRRLEALRQSACCCARSITDPTMSAPSCGQPSPFNARGHHDAAHSPTETGARQTASGALELIPISSHQTSPTLWTSCTSGFLTIGLDRRVRTAGGHASGIARLVMGAEGLRHRTTSTSVMPEKAEARPSGSFPGGPWQRPDRGDSGRAGETDMTSCPCEALRALGPCRRKVLPATGTRSIQASAGWGREKLYMGTPRMTVSAARNSSSTILLSATSRRSVRSAFFRLGIGGHSVWWRQVFGLDLAATQPSAAGDGMIAEMRNRYVDVHGSAPGGLRFGCDTLCSEKQSCDRQQKSNDWSLRKHNSPNRPETPCRTLNDLRSTPPVRHKGFTASDERPVRTQGQDQQALAALEEQLGVRLIERPIASSHTHRIVQSFYERCEPCSPAWRRPRRDRSAAEPAGTVRLSMPPGFAPLVADCCRVSEAHIPASASHPTTAARSISSRSASISPCACATATTRTSRYRAPLCGTRRILAASPRFLEQHGGRSRDESAALPTLSMQKTARGRSGHSFTRTRGTDVSHFPPLPASARISACWSGRRSKHRLLLPDMIVERGFRAAFLNPVLRKWTSAELDVPPFSTSRQRLLPAVGLIDHSPKPARSMVRCQAIIPRPPSDSKLVDLKPLFPLQRRRIC
ncbi:hypothetical protein FQR65_LT20443 [Abscondita terminalis]|nr:hypothetical protein FQR65_LT20443 [Abscondita terminalis]